MEQIISRVVEHFERGKISRRELIRALAVAVAAASSATAATAMTAGAQAAAASDAESAFKAVAVNHISYQVADYAKTRDFYASLLGMEPKNDDGTQCYMKFGDSVLIPRNRPANTPRIDHVAYTIETWDKNAVEAELRRRGLQPTPDTENSFHVRDINGFDLQICGKGMKL